MPKKKKDITSSKEYIRWTEWTKAAYDRVHSDDLSLCPECNEITLDCYRMQANPKKIRAFAWCNKCKHGVHLDRIQVDESLYEKSAPHDSKKEALGKELEDITWIVF